MLLVGSRVRSRDHICKRLSPEPRDCARELRPRGEFADRINSESEGAELRSWECVRDPGGPSAGLKQAETVSSRSGCSGFVHICIYDVQPVRYVADCASTAGAPSAPSAVVVSTTERSRTSITSSITSSVITFLPAA